MRTALLLLAFVALPAFAAQTVWKWVDGDGVTHYSDRPVPGATKVEISGSNRSDADAQPSYSSGPASSQPDAQTGPPYRDFEIWNPGEGESIVNTGGLVPVDIRVAPPLQPGHDLSVYLDGRLVEGFPPGGSSYEMTEVPRGEHRLTAVITNRSGERVQESAPVTFFVRQASAANPPVGPALRPPPKKRPGGAANKLPRRQPSYAALNGAPAPIDPATNLPRKKSAPKPSPAPKAPDAPKDRGD